jgi:hypothetical protein
LAGFIPGVFPEPAALVKPETTGDAPIERALPRTSVRYVQSITMP